MCTYLRLPIKSGISLYSRRDAKSELLPLCCLTVQVSPIDTDPLTYLEIAFLGRIGDFSHDNADIKGPEQSSDPIPDKESLMIVSDAVGKNVNDLRQMLRMFKYSHLSHSRTSSGSRETYLACGSNAILTFWYFLYM